ncbi:replicative DNA helicase [Alkalinema pantanalense CENA528]|uniref:replicative DNA helicase n=1 Tax=Alkalinema pantanalense TaxID=1620705 RepID=UPI003D6F0C57
MIVLPHSVEAEQTVLGAILTDARALPVAQAILRPEDFYSRQHATLYRVIGDLAAKGRPVDGLVLGDHLAANGLDAETGGSAYLAELASMAYSLANLRAHAEIVRDKALLRRMVDAGESIAQAALSAPAGEVASVYAQAQQALVAAAPRAMAAAKTMRDGLRDMVAELQRRMDHPDGMPGVSWTIPALDRLAHRMQPGNLHILAARPSMGKSALAGQVLAQAGRAALFSLEMTAQQVAERMVAHVGDLPMGWITEPNEAPEGSAARIAAGMRLVNESPVLVDDSGGLTVEQLCARARQMHMASPLTLVVVDHLGLIDRPGKNDASELGQVTKALKALAKNLGAPVLLLAQLNRGVESRTDKRPTLADLRDSGRIEEDADTVVMLYRHGYQGEQTEDAGLTELLVRKARQARTGTAYAEADLERMRFHPTDRRPSVGITNHAPAKGFGGRQHQGSYQ